MNSHRKNKSTSPLLVRSSCPSPTSEASPPALMATSKHHSPKTIRMRRGSKSAPTSPREDDVTGPAMLRPPASPQASGRIATSQSKDTAPYGHRTASSSPSSPCGHRIASSSPTSSLALTVPSSPSGRRPPKQRKASSNSQRSSCGGTP